MEMEEDEDDDDEEEDDEEEDEDRDRDWSLGSPLKAASPAETRQDKRRGRELLVMLNLYSKVSIWGRDQLYTNCEEEKKIKTRQN